MPFIHKEELGSGAFGTVYKIVIHESHNRLVSEAKNPFSNVFVLKTFSAEECEQYYRSEVEAFRKLRTSCMPTTGMPNFYGSYRQHHSYNIILDDVVGIEPMNGDVWKMVRAVTNKLAKEDSNSGYRPSSVHSIQNDLKRATATTERPRIWNNQLGLNA
ncbi:hypothetical protein K432DRAFT_408326 [Lepidopterella palustris CBS 459.81]|uniref:Protein kinase domain-containing protein n=1 Tax=Lepidopterella palustris CBS 459.81 TaxID=1314670 RepID=A0A8E2JBG0_9PEZI|nr:hypothetical protein K432DRAFT_408326 [Lepidopterella palustris CBS 459.81]